MKQLLLISTLLLTQLAQSQTIIQQKLDSFLRHDGIKNAAVSICVADANSDSILLATTPQLCLVPASVQKLITSATILEKMGGNFVFITNIWANGKIINRKLNGDLIINGFADPTMGSENFCPVGEKKKFLSEWAHLIKRSGIDTITGDIIASPEIFKDDEDIPNSWQLDDAANYYGASASCFCIYDNIFEITFSVPAAYGQPAEIIKTEPEIPGLIIKNEVLSFPSKRDNSEVMGSPFDNYRIIKGTLPAGAQNFKVKAAIPNPALVLASEFKKALIDSFVFVEGNISKKEVPLNAEDKDKILITWISPRLTDIIEKMNKESVNLYAETFFKLSGGTYSGGSTTTSGDLGFKVFWEDLGIDTENMILVDGSGLSRQNAITSKTLVDILVYMKTKSKWYDAYLKSIPLTGVEGTQKNYFQDSFLKGKAHAKTGSMTRVRSMAGYMTTKNGKEVAFAIIINNYNGTSFIIKEQMEILLENIYQNL
jgi:serine-type D-Ala-D-Ala carboxypeptidase/endopeptidase (penicillin-binding protein 4)